LSCVVVVVVVVAAAAAAVAAVIQSYVLSMCMLRLVNAMIVVKLFLYGSVRWDV